MITKCKKCEIERECNHVHLSSEEKMYFCEECAFRIDKMGYSCIQDYLDNKKDPWKKTDQPQDYMQISDTKTIYTVDSRVHMDIIEHSKGDWRLVKEYFETADKVVLIFSKTLNDDEQQDLKSYS